MTALVAAYLLVVQAILGGLASGAHAGSSVAVDAFGQVICRGNMEMGAPGTGDPAHHTPDCCTTGCQLSAGAALPPPSALAFAAPYAATTRTLRAVRDELHLATLERSPRNARAPPLA